MSLRPELSGQPVDNPYPDDSSAVQPTSTGAVTWPDLHKFPGSYYHKEVTAVDDLTEVDALVRLGGPVYDATRPAQVQRSPDNFSIYLGATQGRHTVDAGLSWDVTLDKNGQKDSAHRAWRPFWRLGGKPKNWQSAPPEPKFYWHPGDLVEMSLRVSRPDKLVLTVADPGPKPQHVFSIEFNAPGIEPGQPLSLRRVTAIDQSGHEGRKVSPTHAKLIGTVWEKTLITGKVAGAQDVFPMAPPNEKAIDVPNGHASVRQLPSRTNPGGEAVDIYGYRKP